MKFEASYFTIKLLSLSFFLKNYFRWKKENTLYRNPTYVFDVKSRRPSTRRRELSFNISGWKDLNLRSSASKAGTLSQLSYTPFLIQAKSMVSDFSPKKINSGNKMCLIQGLNLKKQMISWEIQSLSIIYFFFLKRERFPSDFSGYPFSLSYTHPPYPPSQTGRKDLFLDKKSITCYRTWTDTLKELNFKSSASTISPSRRLKKTECSLVNLTVNLRTQ